MDFARTIAACSAAVDCYFPTSPTDKPSRNLLPEGLPLKHTQIEIYHTSSSFFYSNQNPRCLISLRLDISPGPNSRTTPFELPRIRLTVPAGSGYHLKACDFTDLASTSFFPEYAENFAATPVPPILDTWYDKYEKEMLRFPLSKDHVIDHRIFLTTIVSIFPGQPAKVTINGKWLHHSFRQLRKISVPMIMLFECPQTPTIPLQIRIIEHYLEVPKPERKAWPLAKWLLPPSYIQRKYEKQDMASRAAAVVKEGPNFKITTSFQFDCKTLPIASEPELISPTKIIKIDEGVLFIANKDRSNSLTELGHGSPYYQANKNVLQARGVGEVAELWANWGWLYDAKAQRKAALNDVTKIAREKRRDPPTLHPIDRLSTPTSLNAPNGFFFADARPTSIVHTLQAEAGPGPSTIESWTQSVPKTSSFVIRSS